MSKRLIEDLRARGPLDRPSSEVGSLLAASAAHWPRRSRLLGRPGGYTRTCAYRDAAFEVVLLNWAPGAASPIHDHGDQHCWMFVLEGRLEVEDFVRLDAADVAGYAHVEARGLRALDTGEMDLRSGRFDLHRVAAPSGGPAVSLHIYSRPLSSYLTYEPSVRRCEPAQGVYDDFLPIYSETVRR